MCFTASVFRLMRSLLHNALRCVCSGAIRNPDSPSQNAPVSFLLLSVVANMAKDNLHSGESLPPAAGNTITSFIFLCVFFSVGTAFGYGALKLELEDKLKALLPTAEPLALPLAACMFHVFVMQWLGFCVNNARKRYNVPWPWLYAEKSHPNAIEYNCVQRAHQHYLEQTIQLAIVMGVAATEYPFSAGACTIFFTASKISGNVLGYGSGKASRKAWGMWGYLGLITLTGLALFATIKKFGVEPVPLVTSGIEIATPYAQMAAETAKPYVDIAAETAKPYVDAAAETAKPYVDAAAETAKPYVDAATEAAMPYVEKAAEHAGPYVEAAKAQMGL